MQRQSSGTLSAVERGLLSLFEDVYGHVDDAGLEDLGPSTISATQVRSQVQQYCSQIFGDWSTLKNILARHEAVIRGRWLKKTKKRRKGAAVAGLGLRKAPLGDIFAPLKNPHRTPEWSEPATRPKPAIRTAAESRDWLRELGLDREYLTEKTLGKGTKASTASSADKKKTRKAVACALFEPCSPNIREPERDTAASSLLKVDGRTLGVTHTLFHVSPSDASQVSVPWKDFLHAMVSLGFIPEKLYGSVWQFTPDDGTGLDRGIQFHEPHPDGKLRYHQARRIGRRLTRAYGWTGESFELKEKTSGDVKKTVDGDKVSV